MSSPLRIIEIAVGDAASAWRSAGFHVGSDSCAIVGSVRLRFAGDSGVRGIIGWHVSGVASSAIDGLKEQTAHHRPPANDASTPHPNTSSILDHLVIQTPDVDRTVAAFVASGCEPKRERLAGDGPGALRQVFIRAGEVILEIVGPSGDVDPGHASSTPASLWGLAFTVDDLEECTWLLGENCGTARDAVQPGRRIASLRHAALGISVPTAFMSAKGTVEA